MTICVSQIELSRTRLLLNLHVCVCVCLCVWLSTPTHAGLAKKPTKKHKILIINKRVKAKADLKEAATLGRPGLSC